MSVRTVLWCFSLFGVAAAAVVPSRSPYIEVIQSNIFMQELDHFVPISASKWSQRYFVDASDYVVGGPLFLFITSSAPDYEAILKHSHMRRLAKELHGVAFVLDTRFFGDSHPLPSLTVANMQKYLTVEQIIEDIVAFIKGMTSKYLTKGTVLFGNGIGASYAVWVQEKYPSLMNGVIAYAPQLQVRHAFPEYFVKSYVVADAVAHRCMVIYQTAMDQLDALADAHLGGDIQILFELKSPLNTRDPVAVGALFYDITKLLSEQLLYDTEGIKSACAELENLRAELNHDIEALGKYFVILRQNAQYDMSASYTDQITFLQSEEYLSNRYYTARQEMFLACTQASWFLTSDYLGLYVSDKFQFPFFVQHCRNVFGLNFTADSIIASNERMNKIFGGPNVQNTDNIYFLYSSFDAFRAFGPCEMPTCNTLNIDIVDGADRFFGVLVNNYSRAVLDSLENVRLFVLKWMNMEIT